MTLPSIRPYFNSALEIVIGGGWKLAVMGEVLTTNSGIGGAITSARLNVQPDAIIAWAFLLVAGCFLTQKLLRLLCCRKGGAGMLKLTGISKAFDGLPVLADLSLTLSQGEIVALIGPSGCGKTTLLNIISGLTAPDKGTVEGAEGRLSYMFQSARLLPWRTVEENIRLVREDAPREEVRALISAVGLDGFARYYPGQLSGGMARRCALARAFHFGGELFLMDEPFQGLDYGIRMEMVAMLLAIWRREKPGVLFVTHEIDEALTVATRIAVLTAQTHHRGTVVFPPRPGGAGRLISGAAGAAARDHSSDHTIAHFCCPGGKTGVY